MPRIDFWSLKAVDGDDPSQVPREAVRESCLLTANIFNHETSIQDQYMTAIAGKQQSYLGSTLSLNSVICSVATVEDQERVHFSIWPGREQLQAI